MMTPDGRFPPIAVIQSVGQRVRMGEVGRSGLGCAVVALCINGPLMGLIAISFAQGPYSSSEQELWYRYGSVGLLLCGAILPAIALLLGARRSNLATTLLTGWMVASLVVWFVYVFHSGGGV